MLVAGEGWWLRDLGVPAAGSRLVWYRRASYQHLANSSEINNVSSGVFWACQLLPDLLVTLQPLAVCNQVCSCTASCTTNLGAQPLPSSSRLSF